MICNRCRKEINSKTYITHIEDGIPIAHAHISCFNKQFRCLEEEENESED